jgi:phage terminase large subunit-like protein
MPSLSREEKIELLELAEERERRKARRKIQTYYPETGPLRRELYPRHMEFFVAGLDHRERLMLAANRVGKTEGVGGYEVALHLTGQYPSWWQGRRFTRPVKAWAAGNTSKKVFEILQFKLLGPVGAWGTGLIPGDAIARTVRASGGIADQIDSVYVTHQSGGESQLTFKSYDQRREGFEGTEQDIVWLDEEPPLDIYTECLIRTMTTNGILILTFTPLAGMSDVVLQYLPEGKLPEGTTEINGRAIVMATWDDAPHLTQKDKEELWASLPPFQRDARSKGIPQLGAGAIYPVPESDLLVTPFEIPIHWPRGYGMDVGWNNTACIWGAMNRELDILYLYHEYKRGECEPSVHVGAIQAVGPWIKGFIDPASRGRGQADGRQLYEDYNNLGLDLHMADNGVEAGLYSVWERMCSGKLKVFSSMNKWLAEFRMYRRDDKGKVVKSNDHLMDAMRYCEASCRSFGMKPKPAVDPKPMMYSHDMSQGWMGG